MANIINLFQQFMFKYRRLFQVLFNRKNDIRFVNSYKWAESIRGILPIFGKL